jgi:hypothetical protein
MYCLKRSFACCAPDISPGTAARSELNPRLTPDELRQLAEAHVAQAMRIENGPERLRILTYADALTNLAEIKKLLLEYERRLLN